jgi:predicted RNase H-like HicB family nuclease
LAANLEVEMAQNTINVLAEWDDEAKVWVAESEDFPGLIAEGEEPEELVGKLVGLVHELMELNNTSVDRSQPIELIVRYYREARVVLPVAA